MFGDRLTLLRKEKGITQSELGEQLDVVKSTISLYEAERVEPSMETLIKLADYFGVTTDYLLGRSNNRNDGSVHINQSFSMAEDACRQTYKTEVNESNIKILVKMEDYCRFSAAEDVCKKTVDLLRISNNSHEKEKLCQSKGIRKEDFYSYAFGCISGLASLVFFKSEEEG